MIRGRFVTWPRVIVALVLVALAAALRVPVSAEKLPLRLTNAEFWKLSNDFSEADGTFHSENLVSNEFRFQYVLPSLLKMAKPGRAYLGVGSEQNFTYIAALHPDVAFIIDIRRGNLDLQLMYKALFEMSTDRADFVSRLFSRKRPVGLSASSTAAQIFTAYASVPASQLLYNQNLQAIYRQLSTTHGFALGPNDREGIQFVYDNMFRYGPTLHYTLNGGFGGGGGGGFPTYADLMTADDGAGHMRSYLASEESFTFLKELETRNMVVPVVGNFGGPKAIRAVGTYLKQKQTVVSAFYVSNVEQYLRQDGIWSNFCNNVNTLPLDETSTFIRSMRGGFGGVGRLPGPGFQSEVHLVAGDVSRCSSR